MPHWLALFRPNNYFHHILTPALLASHAQIPSALPLQIRSHPQEFTSFISSEGQPLQAVEKLTLIHLLVLHAPELNQLIEALPLNLRASDPWINSNILNPYQNFIRKFVLSAEQYRKVRLINNAWNSSVSCAESGTFQEEIRQHLQEYFNLELLCYCVNMLNDLFSFLRKVPTLGRYFPKSSNTCFASFVNVASYQTVLLYFSFKFIANELLLRHSEYLPSQHEQVFFRDIMGNHLESINEEMKNLLLNKYYNPIERGIKVTLFELERQSDHSRQALYELNILERENGSKGKKNRRFLGRRIFGEGEFDGEAFEESLEWMGSTDYNEKDLQEAYGKENRNQSNQEANFGQRKGRTHRIKIITDSCIN